MIQENLSIYGRPAKVLTSDQLTTGQITAFAAKVSKSLTESEFTHPVTEDVLAEYMTAGRSVVVIDAENSELLLAHAHLLLPDNGITELAGWLSYAPGCGGEVIRRGAIKAMSDHNTTAAHALVQQGNTRAMKTITKLGGEIVSSGTSQKSGKPVTVYDLTKVGRRQL